MHILSADDIRQIITMPAAIEAVRDGFIALSQARLLYQYAA